MRFHTVLLGQAGERILLCEQALHRGIDHCFGSIAAVAVSFSRISC